MQNLTADAHPKFGIYDNKDADPRPKFGIRDNKVETSATSPII
jgi:hypothetical protein